MNRIEAIELYKSLNELKSDRDYNKFLILAITRTLKELKVVGEEVTAKEQSLMSKEYKDFEEARINLIREYAQKDEKGQVVLEGNNAKIGNNKEEFEAKLATLLEVNKELLAEIEVINKEYEAWLKEEVEVKITKVDFKYIPDELSPKEFATLEYLIKDDVEL